MTIDLIVYDFDGVMTNNKAFVFEDGTEAVIVDRGDGWGVSMLRKQGFRQIILSTETNPVVSARGKKLQIDVVQGSSDKRKSLEEYCTTNGIDLKHVVYIGNDVNDLEAMKIAGLTFAPADSHPDILAIAQHITQANGGDGVVREVADWILEQTNQRKR